jgi:hypothetical protein
VGTLRKLLPLLTVALLGFAAYDGWFFYKRWNDRREAVRQQKAYEAEQARRTIDSLGGGELKILNFYASPPSIPSGGHANLCYGVYGATSVKIEPFVEELHPAVSHCFAASPSRTTEYKLTAVDAAGHTASQTVTVQVR